jgi:catechol 2,3-dioxygenase-like lactoylglutathione lyase family enzyme
MVLGKTDAMNPVCQEDPMKPNKIVPLITTSNLDGVRAFYVDKLGFTVTFDAPMYLGLRCGEHVEIAFITPDDEKCATFAGGGLTLCLEVENVDAEHDRIRSLGIPVVQEPRDNPWGDRSFVALDPVGIALYVYRTTKPSAEFEKFVKE